MAFVPSNVKADGKVPSPRRICDSLKLLAQMPSQHDDNGKVDSKTANDQK